MKAKKRIMKNLIIVFLYLAIFGVATLLIVNGHVKSVGKDKILTVEQSLELEDVDCIIFSVVRSKMTVVSAICFVTV